MKLYNKQLHSLEELRREKHVLKYAAKHTDDWLSFKEMEKEKDTSDFASAGMLGALFSALGSKSMFSTVLAVAPTILTMFSRKSSGSDKKRKNPLESLAKEVIFGYLKWKGIHLGYKALRSIVEGSKEKDRNKKEH